MQTRSIPTLAGVLALAACSPSAPPSAPAGESAATTPPSAATTFPDDVIVSTNEPFWQARVEGATVVLDGPDVDGRHFTVERRDDGADGRRVVARDANGTISVGITAGPCEDSMSGAVFPLSGTLAIDGGRQVRGCARPGGTPPPRPPGD